MNIIYLYDAATGDIFTCATNQPVDKYQETATSLGKAMLEEQVPEDTIPDITDIVRNYMVVDGALTRRATPMANPDVRTYQEQRRDAYPSAIDQLEAIWDILHDNNLIPATGRGLNMFNKIQDVRHQYPAP